MSKGQGFCPKFTRPVTLNERSSFRRLDKKLTFFDVYAISTGAMFSSGFFLLPGIAFAYSGSGVILAYLFAGLLIKAVHKALEPFEGSSSGVSKEEE